tara:strand:+ start:365 stop:532 length:168 start_codon:yes stop_codon:yes gene_type:complete
MDADIHVPKKLRQLVQIDAYTKGGKASISAPRGIEPHGEIIEPLTGLKACACSKC